MGVVFVIMAAEQRKFAQSKSRLSATEARGTVVDTVRNLMDASVSSDVPVVVEEPSIVDPVDYEAELISQKKALESEMYKDLLLFPNNDTSVSARRSRAGHFNTCMPPADGRHAFNLKLHDHIYLRWLKLVQCTIITI